MPEFRKVVQVIAIAPDLDQATGESYTQITLGFVSGTQSISQMNPPLPKVPFWKYTLHIFIPTKQWRGQYTMWKNYEMILKDTGEMTLIPVSGD
jgi:hypothetical protein